MVIDPGVCFLKEGLVWCFVDDEPSDRRGWSRDRKAAPTPASVHLRPSFPFLLLAPSHRRQHGHSKREATAGVSSPHLCPPTPLTKGVKLLQEIEQKSAFAQQQLGVVKSQIASKNRESRMLQLSEVELDTLPKETPIYDGVGKMWDIVLVLPGDLG